MLDPLKVRQTPWLAYPTAVLAFAAAFLLRWWAGETMGGLPFVTFFLAILAVSGVAGTGPAIVCSLLSFMAAWYFFLSPFHGFHLVWPQGLIALGFFSVVAGSQIGLVHWLRLISSRLSAQRRELEKQAELHRLLYHELQHRVANGIQSVASTLAAQASMAPEAQPALDEAATRLQGVAEVHRRLHDPNLGAQLEPMLNGLLRQLLTSAGKPDVTVSVKVETGPVPANIAGMIGLIAAEAASNSIKHAFACRPDGSLAVSLQPVGDHMLRMVIEDDGVGFQASARRDPESLGMMIMQGIAEQLGGELRLGDGIGGGARLSLEFPAGRSA